MAYAVFLRWFGSLSRFCCWCFIGLLRVTIGAFAAAAGSKALILHPLVFLYLIILLYILGIDSVTATSVGRRALLGRRLAAFVRAAGEALLLVLFTILLLSRILPLLILCYILFLFLMGLKK
jgi:hypothetical protein